MAIRWVGQEPGWQIKIGKPPFFCRAFPLKIR